MSSEEQAEHLNGDLPGDSPNVEEPTAQEGGDVTMESDAAVESDATVDSDTYLNDLAAIELLRAEGGQNPAHLETVVRLSVANCFEIQAQCAEASRRAKRESVVTAGPEVVAVFDNTALRAARQAACMVQLGERLKRGGQ